jgi:ABC-type histidine transport system ATPase subunit
LRATGGLAKWPARRPQLLIRDSPSVGVDISAKDGIYEVVKRLAAEGVAVILISNEIPEVLYHMPWILIAYGRVSPILATLGTMTLLKGISIGAARGNVISGFPEPVVSLGNGAVFGVPVALLIRRGGGPARRNA